MSLVSQIGLSSPVPSTIKKNLTLDGILAINNQVAGSVPLTITGASGQTAYLLELKNYAGASVFSVDASGNIINLGDEYVTDLMTVAGNATIGGTLIVTGATTLNSTLSVSGNTTLQDTETQYLDVVRDLTLRNGYLRSASTAGLHIVPAGNTITIVGDVGTVSTHSLTANNDLLVGGKLEVDGVVYFDGGMALGDNDYLYFGDASDAGIAWNTTQTVDGWYFGTATGQNTLIIAEIGDIAYDFAHGAQTNPTLFIHSAAQSTTQWLSLAHDGTNGVIDVGTGVVSIPDGVMTPTIQSINATSSTLTLQNQTFTAGALHNAVTISPTWAAENQGHRGLRVVATQNGANSSVLTGIRAEIVKVTAATTLAQGSGIIIAAPVVEGTITQTEGLHIVNQSIAGSTVSHAIIIESQTANATTTRAIELQGTGVNNAIRLGSSPNIYSSGAEVINFMDSTAARGITMTLTAAGNQTIAATAGTLTLTAPNIGVATGTSLVLAGALSGVTTLSMSGQLTSTLADGTAPFVLTSTTKSTNLNADRVDDLHSSAAISASGALSITANVYALHATGGTAVTIAHSTADGYVHLPSGGSANQILKNSGAAGTGSWGTVTENAGALAAITTLGMAGDLTDYEATNDANPSIFLGSAATERLEITATYAAGTQTLQTVNFVTATASATADYGAYSFNVDGSVIALIDDGGMEVTGSVNATAGFTDGVMTIDGSGAITGVTSLAMGGALSGVTTLGLSQGITQTITVTGVLYDMVLETEWTTGTLINADFAGATVQSGNMTGINLDFNTNLAGVTDQDITGYNLKLPVLTQSTANTTNYTGWNLQTAGALVQNTLAGTINWRGLNIQLPDSTQTTGTVISDGIYITGGAVTSGTQRAIYTTGASNIFGLGATHKIYINATSTAHTDTDGVLDIDVTTATANVKGINLATILTADVNLSAGISVTATKSTNGLTGGNTLFGFEATLVGHASDNGGAYVAFDAKSADKNGGTSTMVAFSSSDADFDWDFATFNIDGQIGALRIIAGNGNNFTIRAGDGVTSGTGGIVNIYGGANAGALADGYVKIGQGAGTPTLTMTDDDLYVVGQFEVDGMVQFDSYVAINRGGAPISGVVLSVGANNTTMPAATTAWRHLQTLGNVTELANATITDIVGAYFNTFTITNGGGTETVAQVSTVYIAGAPTVGTTPTKGPYALFVDAGEVRIDGSLGDTTDRVLSGFFTDLTVSNAIAGSITGNAATVTVADTTDTTCFVGLFEDATGSLAAKTDAGLTYNANTGVLTATGLSGPLTGNVTGNCSGTAATVTGATQASITTLANVTTVGTIGTGVWQGTTIKANYLQQAAADLGDVDITVDLSNSNAGNVTNLTIDGTLTGATLAITDINIGGATIETGSVSTLNIKNGTAPTALVADQIQIYSADTSDNTATLALFLEQAVEDIGTFTPSHKIKVLINGVAYWAQLDAVV